MSFDPVLGAIIALSLVLILLVVARVIADRSYTKIAAKISAENVALKKKSFDLMGAEPVLAIKKFNQSRNIAIIKTRELILDYVFWEKPAYNLQLYLSAASGFLTIVILAAIAKDYNKVDTLSFVIIGLAFFGVFYLFWGNILEVFWKGSTTRKIKSEFAQILNFADSPMDETDKVIKWLKSQDGVADEVREDLENLFKSELKALITKK
ncbi:MAG: hypothetical protein AAF228_01245 [Pseudomonadota bacterium]